MCFKAISQTLFGTPSNRKVAAMEAERAAAAKAAVPARKADEAREDTGAEVLDSGEADIVDTTTDVAVRRTKKPSRKGVPGLGL